MDEVDEQTTMLPPGSLILGGSYRLERLLRHRPRVSLYQGRRLACDAEQSESEPIESLVAIRVLDLASLPQPLLALVEQAAFEEFVSPVVTGWPRVSSAPDRVTTDGTRQYFIMPLERAGPSADLYEQRKTSGKPILLADLLDQEHWPWWLDEARALQWMAQLCRIVARLHRLGTVLGDLTPAATLVDSSGTATWAPILLPAWPPPLHCWLMAATQAVDIADPVNLYRQVFPLANHTRENPFVAPEAEGGELDERSDVYSLGAILYLLLTHYAPAAAWRRLDAIQAYAHTPARQHTEPLQLTEQTDGLALVPPSMLNTRIASNLEHILLRALALDPAERYPSAFALAEEIEALEN